MADSGTLRVQRHRRHRAGDHSLCTPGRCDLAGRRQYGLAPYTPDASSTGFDAAGEMRAMAVRLRDAYAADTSNTGLARELRLTLLALNGIEPPDDDDLMAELRAMTGEIP
jgi:hypothetical protein